MSFRNATHSFRVGLYLAVCLATFCMWLGEDSPPPYPWIVLLLAIAAFAFTDHWGRVVMPPRIVALAGLAVFAYFIREEIAAYQLDPFDYVMPLGHLFVLFQVILFFHRKTPKHYGYMMLMSFLEMAIAALHNNRLGFGALMSVYLVLMVWTLTRFNLVRESERHAERVAAHSPVPTVRRSLAASLGSGAAIVITATFLFLLIPRQGETAWTHSQFRSGQYLSGFDDTIRLGQLGTILESDDEVMTVHMYDENGQPYRPVEEPLWRGVTLAHYEDGRWERRADLNSPARSPWLPGDDAPPGRFIRQEISLKMVHRDVLFGLRPFVRGTTRGGEALAIAWLDGTLIRPEDVGSGPMQYTIDSYVEGDMPQPHSYRGQVRTQGDKLRREQYLEVPPEVRARMLQYVGGLNLPATGDPHAFAGQLLNHFLDPKKFDYTLDERRIDPTIDPVLDFLWNRKEGHCEYFASALALMLRSYGVPARVVNGFRGGDWNEFLGKFIVVRQKHAHSWVEAVLETPDRRELHWVTLDPTPGQSRQRLVANVNRSPLLWQQFRDLTRQLWSSYVLNFNAGEQDSAIYRPFRLVVTEQAAKFMDFVRGNTSDESGRFNWLAALIASGLAVVTLTGARFVVRRARLWRFVWAENGRAADRGLLRFIARQIRRLFSAWHKSSESARHRVVFYDELLHTLALHGIRKRPAWTPQQFAEHAGSELERAAVRAAAAAIPAAIVQRFYRVRFGDDSLSDAEAKDTHSMLERLAETLARKE